MSRCGSVTVRLLQPFRLQFTSAPPLRYPLNAGEESLPLRGRWHGEAMTEGACENPFDALSFTRALRGSSLPEGAFFASPLNGERKKNRESVGLPYSFYQDPVESVAVFQMSVPSLPYAA